MDVRGRDMVTGLPKTISLTSSETLEALSEPVQAIVQCVKGVLERTPPELAADIIDKGIVLTGGRRPGPWIGQAAQPRDWDTGVHFRKCHHSGSLGYR